MKYDPITFMPLKEKKKRIRIKQHREKPSKLEDLNRRVHILEKEIKELRKQLSYVSNRQVDILQRQD